MLFLILFIIVWLALPLFLIPYSISVKNENERLKNQLSAVFDEQTRMNKNFSSDTVSSAENHLTSVSTVQKSVNTVYNETEFYSTLPDAACEKQENQITESEFGTVKDDEKNGNHISVLLAAGVSLILIAGLIFVTSAWSVMGPLAKIFIITLAPVLFFGISAVTEKKFSIYSTSKAFYYLGSFFIPLSLVGMIFFQVFGEYFSFEGDGLYLALMAVFLSCSFSAFLISKKYSSQFASFVSVSAVSVSVLMAGLWTHSNTAMILISALYSFILLLVSRERLESLNINSTYAYVIKRTASVNAAVMSLVSTLISAASGSLANTVIALVFMISSTLFIQYRTEDNNVKRLCSIFSVFEYGALFLTLSNMFETGLTSFIIPVSLYIAAFVFYTFSSEFSSSLSRMILIISQFLLMFMTETEYMAVWCTVMLVSVVAAFVTEKSTPVSVVYSTAAPAVFYGLLISADVPSVQLSLIFVLVLSALSLACIFCFEKSDRIKYSSVSMLAYTAFSAIMTSSVFYRKHSMTLVLVISALVFAAAYFYFRKNVKKAASVFAGLISSFNIHFFLFINLAVNSDFKPYVLYLVSSAVTLILGAAGLMISERHRTGGRIVAHTSGIFMLLTMTKTMPSYESGWLAFMLAVITVSLVLSGKTEYNITASKILYTAASVFVSIILFSQNLFDVPDVIRGEITVLYTLVPYIFFFRIWREESKKVENILFVHSVLSMFLLMLTAFSTQNVIHAVILGTVCVALQVVSAVIKSRKWMRFASVSLSILVIYITRDFWRSIAWWVYLMAAGIILISYAAFNEYCRKTGAENFIRSKVKKMMHSERS